jgi:HD-GYP domain-containing protein (c-di-GMP phosphodiesterase class II)
MANGHDPSPGTGTHPDPAALQGTARSEYRSDVKDALVQLLTDQSATIISHLAQVAQLATQTAINLGLPPSLVELTRLSAELHDVGKMGIPAKILEKPGPLSVEEQWFVQRHSEIGEGLIEAMPALRAVAPIVRAVHERPDGRGYPDGLVLEQIPISARIIAVVDAFDAMTSHRPYQQPVSPSQALAELRLHAGAQFDTAVVEAFAAAVAHCDPALHAA